MKILKWVLGVVITLAAVLVLGGMALSPKFKVSRSITINAPADKVYALLADPRRWKEWSVWNRRHGRQGLRRRAGQPEGTGRKALRSPAACGPGAGGPAVAQCAASSARHTAIHALHASRQTVSH